MATDKAKEKKELIDKLKAIKAKAQATNQTVKK